MKPEKTEQHQAGGRAAALNREFSHNAAEIEQLTPQWEAAATKLADLEAGE